MSDLFHLPLAEKYRPKSLDEVIGQPKLIAQVQGLKARGGLGGRAYWLSGRSGGGKSSTARLIARDLADDLNIEVSDARRCRTALVPLHALGICQPERR
jgi:DNA polymerase III gamma/tau subunit